MLPFMEGFGTGCGLIIAIGAQNAFVLSQGVKREYHLIIPLICAIFDALLITAGVAGIGAMISESNLIRAIAGWGGAMFLFWYGCRSFRSAFRGGGSLNAEQRTRPSLKSAILFTLGVTILNPHVYLDTVILLGGLAAQLPDKARYAFGMGAVCASFVWFFALSLGGKIAAPVLSRPGTWRIVECCVGVVMWSVALGIMQNAARIPVPTTCLF